MGSALPEELRDSVAVIGMALRVPGASSTGQFWRNLIDGVESISFFSQEDLLNAGEDSETLADSSYINAFGRIDGADLFDASLFRFTPADARQTDPQLRLLLTCSWEALEDAGYGVAEQESPVGVFVGAAESYYTGHNRTHSAGGLLEFLATQISYKLNLKGPGLSLQTACSTSLVCVHMAIRSLLDGECDMALAGASSIRRPQTRGYLCREGHGLSSDGHCRPFDARAEGVVGGNGAAVVLLKRMEDAWADGDPIRAVIRGSAINNNGFDSRNYWRPNAEGQAEVIEEAQALARVDADSISYVETHGTGAPADDAVEIQALREVFRDVQDAGSCGLGSVKGNLGHLNTAAGMAGLIKTVLALEHQQLPANLHFETPHPELDLAGGPFFINGQSQPWEVEGPRRAGVSAFGIGGSNAHVILEEAPPRSPAPSDGAQLLILSARSETALGDAVTNLAEHMRAHPDLELADVAKTLQVGRRHWPLRRALTCRSLDEAVAGLSDSESSILRAGEVSPNAAPQVVFLLSGEAPDVGMGSELYRHEPVFREELDRCGELLKAHLEIELRDLLYPDGATSDAEARWAQADVAQPVLLAFEISLAKTWLAKGLCPSALIGWGVGEYAAAHVAGIFNLEDVFSAVIARSKLAQVDAAGMELMLEPFARHLTTLNFGTPEIPIISPLTGEVLTATEASGPEYWCRQLHETDRVGDPLQGLDSTERVFLEIGPGTLARETLEKTRSIVPSLASPNEHLWPAIGDLWLAGVRLDWQRIHGDQALRRVSLPATPLELQSYRPRAIATPKKVSTAPVTPKPAPRAKPAPGTKSASSTKSAPRDAPIPARVENVPPLSPLESVLNDQLQLMNQQLDLLSSQALGAPLPTVGVPDGAVTPQIIAAGPGDTRALADSRPTVEIPKEVAATHLDLSRTSYRFLEYVLENPEERGRPLDHRAAGRDLEGWIQRVSFELQSWPTFIGHRKRDQVSRAALSVISLVRGIYEHIFENDPDRIAAFHDFETRQVAEFLVSSPNGLDNCLVRCDFSDSQRGLKCLEVNASGSISGWQHLFWEKILRQQPVIADFIAREGIEPAYHDVLRAFLTHVVDDCRSRGLLEGGHLNLAMANERRAIHVTRQAAPRLNRLAAERLRPMGLTGTIFVCTMADLELRNGQVFHGSERIHAIHQTDFEPTPRDVLFCQKDEAVVLYNTPLAFMLGDKRLIALLSEHAESQRFSAEQRAAIHKYIPWTRRVKAGPVGFEGQEMELKELLTRDPERFVLKKGLGSGGLDVHVGQYTPRPEWNAQVAIAIQEEDWIAQEFLPYRPYFFQGGEMGAKLHHAVYGAFCFGNHYGGCFLRTREPGDCGGVINSTRGAIESLVFEVEEEDAAGLDEHLGGPDLRSAIESTHEDLSQVSRRFLEHARSYPEMARATDYRNADVPAWLKHFTYELQTWPIFVGEAKLDEIRNATLSVMRLLRDSYSKLFDNDSSKIADFYGYNDTRMIEFLLAPPHGIDSSMARCDFIDTGQGFQCLEVNMSANIGGWQLAFWEKICRSQPAIQDFLEREGLDPVYHDLLETLFAQILDDCRRHGVLTDDRLSVVLVTEEHKIAAARPAAAVLNERFCKWLEETAPELDGEFRIAAFSDDLAARADDVTLGGSRIHCLLKAVEAAVPQEILLAFKQRQLMLYNTPPAALLSDKRLLAVLSEHVDSPRLSAEEQQAIRRYVPWSRLTGERSVSFEGQEVSLTELLLEQRERFVLKGAAGAGGEQVHVGASTPPERWLELVHATASQDWIAQEHLQSRPYLFQTGEQGAAAHDAVWGLFCFGDRYAGGFLRIMPQGEGDGVLNAARGASEAFIYQVSADKENVGAQR